MIEKFARVRGLVQSEFLDLNHTTDFMILVSLMIAKFARDAVGEGWRTSHRARAMGLFTWTKPDTVLDETRRNQAAAADPTASAWVSANAGTGKTHVLTMRVLRLLLAGTPPERILALTYTKAAAAEMSKRVFERLAAG